jgi:S-DNA-T family DNA segregation ATPase FtsK/SpoIIIE
MAAQSRARASSSGRRAGTSSDRDTLPFRPLRRFGGLAGRVRRFRPTLALTDRLQREVLGILLVLVALLSAWALGRGRQDGPVVAWWGGLLADVFGWIALLVPVYLALTAIRAFRVVDQPVLLPRHLLGGFAYAVGAAGLLQLGAGGGDENVAGYVGRGIAALSDRTLGAFASGLVLTAGGVVGVFLLADMDLRTFEAEVRALWPRRRNDDPSEAGTSHQGPLPSVPTPVTAVARVAEPAKQAEPVINVPAREKPPAQSPVASTKGGRPMPLPDLGKLAVYDGVAPDRIELNGKARRIEETLANFRVEARVREVNPGPTVTQFALEPGVGVPVRRILALEKDLALALAAPSIRIEAPVPGMARLGIEIPNAQSATVGLREVLESSAFVRGKAKLPVPLGQDVNGRYVVGDLTKMPHLLIAGQTGSGKSVCLNAIITTFLLSRLPEDLKLLMIDPKMVELTGYNGVPHLQCPVVAEMDKVVGALKLTVREMSRRYDLFAKLGVRNLEGFRMKLEAEPGIAEPLPYLVVIVDELADLMMTAGAEVEDQLVRLGQLARAAGIHLILATQRPSVNVITGMIKANVPARIAFAVAPTSTAASSSTCPAPSTCSVAATCSTCRRKRPSRSGSRVPRSTTRTSSTSSATGRRWRRRRSTPRSGWSCRAAAWSTTRRKAERTR